jgi:hypothetical protein
LPGLKEGTCNKINGAIRRRFGKQMNKETKLSIHNMTAKAALKFGSNPFGAGIFFLILAHPVCKL